jgi:hypothetical protein
MSSDLSPEMFLERLKEPGLGSSLVLTGMAKAIDGERSSFSFSLTDCDSWIELSVDAIESVQVVGSTSCNGDHSHPRIRVTFKGSDSWMYQLLAAMADAVYRAGQRQQAAHTTNASDQCLRCIDACKLVTYPPEDPFGQLVCILSCPGCP